ncbi:MAG: permease [Vulcanimicrobiaceae bacterium]
MTNDTAVAPIPAPQRRLMSGALMVLVLAVAGLFYVKWAPYYAKSFVAAAHHTIGASIVSGKAAEPPAAGWSAALTYARSYYLAIWQALVLGLLLGATIQVFFPRQWMLRWLGGVGLRSTVVAGTISLAGMMCTCCAAPVVIGLRKQNASLGAAMAFFVANPVMNPATLIFIGFVLGWQFTALRVVVGIMIILVIAWYANTYAKEDMPKLKPEPSPIEKRTSIRELGMDWLRALWWEIYTIIPGYIVIVLLLGAARAWLFTPTVTLANGGFLALIVLAIAATLFVIPTAGEVPIIQTLMGLGMGIAPALVLLVALPAISLPSVYIVRAVFPKQVLAASLGIVAVAGLLTGIVGKFFIAS